jgi:hypothetical protein
MMVVERATEQRTLHMRPFPTTAFNMSLPPEIAESLRAEVSHRQSKGSHGITQASVPGCGYPRTGPTRHSGETVGRLKQPSTIKYPQELSHCPKQEANLGDQSERLKQESR